MYTMLLYDVDRVYSLILIGITDSLFLTTVSLPPSTTDIYVYVLCLVALHAGAR
jgi:hypothetical protein